MTTKTEQKQNDDAIVRLPLENMARLRATAVILFFIALAAFLIIIFKTDFVHKKFSEFENQVLDYVGGRGFGLEDVIVVGRQKTTVDELNRALQLKRNDNLLKIDISLLKRRLDQLPWIRDVRIIRHFFPNILKIEIAEKEVFALWQFNERLYPLDYDGYVIEAEYKPRKQLLLVVGDGAPDYIKPVLKMIADADKSYLPRVKVINFISGRRFNIILDDIKEGITVKLPEENFEEAWKKLIELDKVKGILKRKLTIIDLRLKDKVIVRLRKTKVAKKRLEQNI